MSVVGGARKPRHAPDSSVLAERIAVVRVGGVTSSGSNGVTVAPAGANRAATLPSPWSQRCTSHADTNVSARIVHAQPSKHGPSKQRSPASPVDARTLAKAGDKTTFISRNPHSPSRSGRAKPRVFRSDQPDELPPSAGGRSPRPAFSCPGNGHIKARSNTVHILRNQGGFTMVEGALSRSL